MKWPKRIILVRHGESKFNEMKEAKKQDSRYHEFVELFEQEMGTAKYSEWVRLFPQSCVSKELLMLAKEMLEKYQLPFSNHETPLTKRGRPQAEALGRELRVSIPRPDVVLCSPYLRGAQTLQGIIRGWPELEETKVETEPLVREIETGLSNIFNDWRILETFFPEQRFLFLKEGRFDYGYPHGENVPRVMERMKLLSAKLIREFSGKEVLIVSHHITILSFVAIQLRWSKNEFITTDDASPLQNCSYTIFEGDPTQGENGKLALKTFNTVPQTD